MLEDILQACVGVWERYLPLIEFAYNNSYHSFIQMAPFEALYERKCKSPIGWFEVGEVKLLGPNLVQDAIDKVKIIREKFQVGDQVFLKISPIKWVIRFGKKDKLSPIYIGPFPVM